MAISRTYAAGWNLYDKFTSAMANAIDTALTYAADKRAGQSDTVGASWTMTGAGRVVETFITGADADTTYAVSAGIRTILTGSLTANRNYTLSVVGAIANDRTSLIAHGLYDVLVYDAGTGFVATIGPNGLASAEFRFDGTSWSVFKSTSSNVTVTANAVAVSRLYLTP